MGGEWEGIRGDWLMVEVGGFEDEEEVVKGFVEVLK